MKEFTVASEGRVTALEGAGFSADFAVAEF
jgi:hypothetical protein